jgi:hypothetical protein
MKSKIPDRNQWRLLASVGAGDFAARDRSASLFDAYCAASFDKFSPQKRRIEKTAKSLAGDYRRLAIASRANLRDSPCGRGVPAGIFAFSPPLFGLVHMAL